MLNITFRPPKLSDLDQLLEFINTLSQERTFIRKQGGKVTRQEEEEYLKKFLKDIDNKKAVKILAFDGDKLVGAADIKMSFGAEKHVGIFGIVVAKNYRQQGIGSQLMKKVIATAKENISDLEIITLGVFSDNNLAKHLYQKFGFKEYGQLPKGVMRKGEYFDHIYMYKSI